MGNDSGGVAHVTTVTGGRRSRPCDSCRKRKRRCYVQIGEALCQLCRSIGAEECTFTETEISTTSSQKRSAADGVEQPLAKRIERYGFLLFAKKIRPPTIDLV